ncbi:MAG: thiamine diphosphokinase [Candidatus Azobacteroides sp.]|nr:thiamine diphosphokinase [Candidatus Azobacteroides sp.]
MIPLLQNFRTVILANGAFPKHKIPLEFLFKAEQIVCCDGAAQNLLNAGLSPDYIIGDMDSVSEEIKNRFASIILHLSEQETNDLTKAVNFCMENNWTEITILGATGKREDHTLGNLSLLTDYAEKANVQLLTDDGVFTPLLKSDALESYHGEQISIFSLETDTVFTFHNLLYPVHDRKLTSWWQGTLNEAVGNCFTISIDRGKALVFRTY